MAGEFLSLQEVADELGKSTQTIRRMIKKGEIKAERIRTPQGFQYAIERGALAHKRTAQVAQEPIQTYPASSPTPSPMVDMEEAPTSQDLTGYETVLTSQKMEEVPGDSSSFLENDFYILEPTQSVRESLTHERLIELVYMHHKEKLMLITILERLQAELAEKNRAKKIPLSRLKKLWACFKRG